MYVTFRECEGELDPDTGEVGELRRTCSMDLLTPSPHALKCELEEMSFRFIDDTTEDVEDILNDTRKELECQANQEIQKFKTTAKRAADTVVDETKVKLSEATREEVKHFRNEVSSESSKISIDNQKLIKDLKERLQQDYKKRLGSIPLSPLVPTINNKLYNFYVQPNISKPKPGTKGQHDDDDKSEVVVSYKDIFWSHNSKKKYADVYLQGEPEGLDEWSYSDHRIVPEKRMRKKCTILTTSRPWRMAKVAVAHSDIDAVLTISGIENAEVLAEKTQD
ncbi:hypothetical protein MAR_034211 [Mya arenaria]|uniref:Uncharacterized protein n=1 Tax=Mya arenaria TaxID=6604 RepID=A0ABY7GDT6_MYAAR|nr:hypothetical protein MAR_034211 [Mya arenaria]